uniref:Uncharacterized protein n=1 Tax=Romanomermis culicivorax TaxID=13658 RepID=A0A915KMW2_ROMCU
MISLQHLCWVPCCCPLFDREVNMQISDGRPAFLKIALPADIVDRLDSVRVPFIHPRVKRAALRAHTDLERRRTDERTAHRIFVRENIVAREMDGAAQQRRSGQIAESETKIWIIRVVHMSQKWVARVVFGWLGEKLFHRRRSLQRADWVGPWLEERDIRIWERRYAGVEHVAF